MNNSNAGYLQYLNAINQAYGGLANQPNYILPPEREVVPQLDIQSILAQSALNNQMDVGGGVTPSPSQPIDYNLPSVPELQNWNPSSVSSTKTDKKSLGGFVKNTLVNRPLELFSGFGDVVTHLPEYGEQLGGYLGRKAADVVSGETMSEKLLPIAETARDVSDFLVYKPLTGQSISDIVEDPSGTLGRFGEHIYQGGLADIGLTLAPTKGGQAVGKAVGRGVSKVASKIDDASFGGKGKEILNVAKAKKEIISKAVTDKLGMEKTLRVLSRDVKDMFHNNNIKETDFADMIKKMEGAEGKSLADMTPEQQKIYPQFKKILDEYDNLVQQHTTATPKNITEIVQRGVRESQRKGINNSYQNILKNYEDSGLFDYGHYIDKESGKIVKEPLYKAEQNPSIRQPQIGDVSYPSLEQILRRNNMTSKFNFESQMKKLNKKFEGDLANPDLPLETAELRYRKMIKDTIDGDRESIANSERVFEDIINELPPEYREMFGERYARDITDIQGSKYSTEPISDLADPKNLNRYKSFNDKLSNVKKYGDVSYNTPLASLSKRTRSLIREHLTPEEYTDFLEAGATLKDVRSYIREVANTAKEEFKKPHIAKDSVTGEPVELDLRNTEFVIPEENLDALSLRALDDPLAKEFLDSYQLAKEGKLQRISHGLADVDKSGAAALTRRGTMNKSNKLYSERTYGTASAADIASEWANPDTLFNHAIKGLLREKTLNKWFDEFRQSGHPIMSTKATPEDIRYVSREMLGNSKALKNLNDEQIILKRIPEGANAADYIPVDKYTLQAYRELFFPEATKGFKVPKIVKDITYLFKQGLLASGLYLFGNLAGGLHSFITNSNIHLLEDISSAIKTRGNLIKDLGTHREIPTVRDVRLKPTAGMTSSEKNIYKGLQGLETVNNWTGSNLARKLDAKIQNAVAEANAHSMLRKNGVRFEDRNFNHLRDTMTNEQIYNLLDDIQKSSLIYGDFTLLPKEMLGWAETFQPFFRWIDQATQSSGWLLKNNPVAYGYLQGAVLGGLAWDQNEARAQGLNISNPQSGKIYRQDKNGNTKVTETEIIPILTTLKTANDPMKILTAADKNATIGFLTEPFKTTDKYGRMKLRKEWGDIVPDYRTNKRYKDGMIQEVPELDEIVKEYARGSVPMRFLNQTVIPLSEAFTGEATFQPYNDQLFVGNEGNPLKPYGLSKLQDRALTQYTHNVFPGQDDVISDKTERQLKRQLSKREQKALKAKLEAQKELE